jgi:hypothetical protein
MTALDLTQGVSYRDILRLAEDLDEADVVRAEFATGGGELLKGREIVERIARTGKAESVPMLTIIVVNTTQAEILSAMLRINSMDKGMARKAASMLNEAIAMGPERLH